MKSWNKWLSIFLVFSLITLAGYACDEKSAEDENGDKEELTLEKPGDEDGGPTGDLRPEGGPEPSPPPDEVPPAGEEIPPPEGEGPPLEAEVSPLEEVAEGQEVEDARIDGTWFVLIDSVEGVDPPGGRPDKDKRKFTWNIEQSGEKLKVTAVEQDVFGGRGEGTVDGRNVRIQFKDIVRGEEIIIAKFKGQVEAGSARMGGECGMKDSKCSWAANKK